jgi:hypothetical protein
VSSSSVFLRLLRVFRSFLVLFLFFLGFPSAFLSLFRFFCRNLFGARALELKRGRLALTVENGKVVTLEWRDAEEPAIAEAAGQ